MGSFQNGLHLRIVRIVGVITVLALSPGAAVIATDEAAGAKFVYPDYAEPQVVFDIFLDEPAKLASALFWVRSLINPLLEAPYGFAPEFMDIKVVLHGTEVVTVAKKNYAQYRDIVERMKYYDQIGVEFKVCALSMDDYGYSAQDLQPFVQIVPSAMTEVAHWQQEGYAVLVPQVLERRQRIEEIR